MKKNKTKPWSDADRKTLAMYYFHASIEEVCSLLPERSIQSIRNQVNYLKKRGYRFR
jgi:hypothetical protein